jgi:hypothetical protein
MKLTDKKIRVLRIGWECVGGWQPETPRDWLTARTLVEEGLLRRPTDTERCRKRTLYSVPCEKCGKPFGGIANGHAGHVGRFCKRCAHEVSAEKQKMFGAAVLAEVEAMWDEDLPVKQIADEMGWTPNSTQAYICRHRAKGARLPYRREASPRNKQRQRKRGREAAQALHASRAAA